MKNIRNIVFAELLMIAATSSIAATQTLVESNWICTTNASTSTVTTDVDADSKMAKTQASASDAFAFATANCRDCTKITCEAQNK